MAKIKKSSFAFDWTKLEEIARVKTGLPMPDAIDATGTNSRVYYANRANHKESVPMIKSILSTCEELGLTLNEFRSLFIEQK